jgi:hypothetical protein
MTIQQHASFDSSAAELNATSKLVKAWESKNAKNAAKAGGISLMALSLAACGGSSSTTTTPVVDTPVVDTTPVAGLAFALTSAADVISPNSATAATKSTANDDTFRAAVDGGLTSADIIDGGDGNDTLTAVVAEGGSDEAIKPSLTSVENVKFTMSAEAAGADSPQTFDFADSTGVVSVEVVNIDDADVTVQGITTSTTVTASGTAGVAADSINTITLSGLSTATDGGADAYTVNLNDADLGDLSVAGVETLTLNLSGKAVDVLDLSAGALEKLIITGGVNDVDSTTEAAVIGSGVDIAFAGLDTGESAVIDASGSTNDVTLTVASDDDDDLVATGGAGTFKLTMTGTDDEATVAVTAGAGGIDVVLIGGDNQASDTAINTITATGSAAADIVDISALVDATNITATAADESKSVNATVSTAGGADTVTIHAGVVNVDTGAGNDTVVIEDASELTVSDTVAGGDDTDTLKMVSAEAGDFDGLAATVLAKVTGFEKVLISDVYDTVYDATVYGANYIVLADDVDGANIDLTVADNATIEFTDAAGGDTDELDLIVKNAAAAGQNDNTVNFVFNVADLVTANVTYEVEVDDVENLNISAVTTDTDTTTKDYIYDGSANGGVTTVVITGTEDVQYTASSANQTIDATGSGNYTIVGAAGAMTINTGAGADDVTAAGADVVNTGAGNDTLTSDGTNAATFTGGAGTDTFEMDDSSVVKDFTVGAGGDVLKTTGNSFDALITESATDLTLKVVAEATSYSTKIEITDNDVIGFSTDAIADFNTAAEIFALMGTAASDAFDVIDEAEEFTLLVADTTTGKVHAYDLLGAANDGGAAESLTLVEFAVLEGVSADDLGSMVAANFVA